MIDLETLEKKVSEKHEEIQQRWDSQIHRACNENSVFAWHHQGMVARAPTIGTSSGNPFRDYSGHNVCILPTTTSDGLQHTVIDFTNPRKAILGHITNPDDCKQTEKELSKMTRLKGWKLQNFR